MDLSEFLRLYPMRAPQMMWFLGAGASAAAGIPTAYHMIWEFKRSLYCSGNRVSLSACADLSNDMVRTRIQRFCNSLPGAPAQDSNEEYSYYFEAAYRHEADRRKYIDRSVSRGKPSFGHLALATMFKIDFARAAWTTNFDRVVEDAVANVMGSSAKLVTAAMGEPKVAREAMTEGRWPLLVKLHGDFHSRRLKNTADELLAQDSDLRKCLVEACVRQGLAVVGYSGRDTSVMDALEQAIERGAGFPSGLFWFHRPDSPVLPRVADLILKASAAGVDAHLITNDNFDELMGDVLALIPDVPPEVTMLLASRRTRVSNAPVPPPPGGWPVIRLNAFPVTSFPSVCRLVQCKIGGFTEVREAVKSAGVNVLAGRRQMGVIAFGRDEDVRTAFRTFDITAFDLHSIEPRRLRYDSAELGLLYDSLCAGLSRQRPIKVCRRWSSWVLAVDHERLADRAYDSLKAAIGTLAGVVPQTPLTWTEACRVRLEYRLDRLWLLAEPTIWYGETIDAAAVRIAKEFVRNRLAARYNMAWHRILDGWGSVVVGDGDVAEIRALGTGEGVDAVFRISKKPAFSWRGGVR